MFDLKQYALEKLEKLESLGYEVDKSKRVNAFNTLPSARTVLLKYCVNKHEVDLHVDLYLERI